MMGKKEHIKAIFKKHKDDNLGNYRPVDLRLWESYKASLLEMGSSYMKNKKAK